jgi:hypothetical protein
MSQRIGGNVKKLSLLVLLAATMPFSGCKKNQVPNQAAAPSGPTSGRPDELLSFTSSATDPDGDGVAIRFDWGDGDTSDWSAVVAGGTAVTDSHSWSAASIYSVRAQAKDAGDVLSAWSDGHQLSVALSWTRTFGGTNMDDGRSVQQTSDGGYIITGFTWSFGAGLDDVYLIKTNASGDTLWIRTYGGTDIDEGYSVQQTSDGGYIIAGTTASFGAGGTDIYLIRTSASGDTLWTRTYGEPEPANEYCYSVRQTGDGGFIVAGLASGGTCLIKTDASGNTLWTRTCGLRASSVQQTTDGGYVIAGVGNSSVCLVKTGASGDELWTRYYGYGSGESVQQTTDGGYIIVGSGGHVAEGNSDVYLVRTDANGDTIWTKTYGGTGGDAGNSVQQTSDGGYIIAGCTTSFGAGLEDVYLIKTNPQGDTLWARTYGGQHADQGFSVQQTTDGGYIVAGLTLSYGAGYVDVWLIKTDADGNVGTGN